MQWRHMAAGLILTTAATAVGLQAKAAPLRLGPSGPSLTTHADPAIQDVYWVWRGGVRVWVAPYPGPSYRPPRCPTPRLLPWGTTAARRIGTADADTIIAAGTVGGGATGEVEGVAGIAATGRDLRSIYSASDRNGNGPG